MSGHTKQNEVFNISSAHPTISNVNGVWSRCQHTAGVCPCPERSNKN